MLKKVSMCMYIFLGQLSQVLAEKDSRPFSNKLPNDDVKETHPFRLLSSFSYTLPWNVVFLNRYRSRILKPAKSGYCLGNHVVRHHPYFCFKASQRRPILQHSVSTDRLNQQQESLIWILQTVGQKLYASTNL